MANDLWERRGPAASPWMRACLLATLLLLPACGGDPPQSPDPGPQPVAVTGSVVLPPGYPAATALSLACGTGTTAVATGGAFTVATEDGGAQLAVVYGADGPLLMGWISSAAATVSARTTAEVTLYFTLGAWLLPADGQVALRNLIAGLGTELDDLTAAIAAAAVTHPAGLTTPDPAVRTALAAAVAAARDTARQNTPGTAPGAKGLVIDPAQQQSGVAVVHQGGINTITLRNAYRRRVLAFVQRTAWVDRADLRHELDEPATSYEIDPVSGFAGVVGTIGGWLGGDNAYTPKASDPLPLPIVTEGRFTEFRVTVGGAGLLDPVGLVLPNEETAFRDLAVRSVVLDYFLPMMVNFVSSVNQLDGLDDLLGGVAGSGDDALAFVAYCKDTVPALVTHVREGDCLGAVFDLYGAVSQTGEFRTRLFHLLEVLFVVAGAGYDNAAVALERAGNYLDLVGWFDVGGSLLDTVVVSSHLALSRQADTWWLQATLPSVHLSAAPATLAQGDAADSLWVRVEDDLEDPEGWAFAYRWRCAGATGTLVNPAHPDDRSNDFTTSNRRVGFVADGATAGVEAVIVEVAITQGGDLTPVGADTLQLTVTPRTVTLTPTTTNVAADAVRWFAAKCDPPLPEGTEVVYAWSGGGQAGTLRSADGTLAPCETADADATYHAGQATGSDEVAVTVYRVFEGGERRRLGAATATASVRPDMIEGRLVGRLNLYPEQSYYEAPVVVEFTKKPGTTRYLVHGYNYHDFTGYYGDSYLRTGPPFDSHDFQTDTVYSLFLTGMSGSLVPGHPPTEDEALGWNMARFEGSVWEVWPQN